VVVAVFFSGYTAGLLDYDTNPFHFNEKGFLHGLSRPYVDYLSSYLAVNPSAILP